MDNKAWQEHVVIKNPDGTFVIIHDIGSSSYAYHVCSKDIDPDNLYDIAEVAAFWESLPAGDPRKQVYVEPEPAPDTRTSKEKREDAYVIEADPLFRQYEYYSAEAAAADLLDDEDAADTASGEAQDFLIAYYQKKLEIRERFPDEAAEVAD